MGIALFTLPALQNPLRSLKRLFSDQDRAPCQTHTGGAPTDHHRSATTSAHQPPWGCQAGHSSGDAAALPLKPPHPANTPGHRPLRGNWPFTVRPPARTPEVPGQQPVTANRSFLPMASMGSNSGRHTFFESLAADTGTHRTPRILRRASDSGTGRLVIAGRMADVCAELDRMAASEAIQA